VSWGDAGRPLLDAGHELGTPAILFRKVEDGEIEAQRERLAARARAADDNGDSPTDGASSGDRDPVAITEYQPVSETATIDQFAALDLRAARITAAEDHPKADKLLVLTLDLGFEARQILSGVRPHLSAADVVGKTVVVVANFAPRTLRGLESQGMVLTAEDRDGRLSFVETSGEPGAVVR
jgi:methionyl-tRNA synthetase